MHSQAVKCAWLCAFVRFQRTGRSEQGGRWRICKANPSLWLWEGHGAQGTEPPWHFWCLFVCFCVCGFFPTREQPENRDLKSLS